MKKLIRMCFYVFFLLTIEAQKRLDKNCQAFFLVYVSNTFTNDLSRPE